MNKGDDKLKVDRTKYQALIKPMVITVFFYWIALGLYSIYEYFSKGNFGAPIFILIFGVLVFTTSSFINQLRLK